MKCSAASLFKQLSCNMIHVCHLAFKKGFTANTRLELSWTWASGISLTALGAFPYTIPKPSQWSNQLLLAFGKIWDSGAGRSK